MRSPTALLVAAALLAGGAHAADTKRFASKRYGYSFSLPVTWSGYQPTAPWAGGTPLPNTVDTYSGPGETRIVAAARRLSAGTTLAKFTAAVLENTPAICGKAESNVLTKLGGEPARLFTHHCSDGYYLINVTAVHGGRGFIFISISRPGQERADRLAFRRVRDSWRFTR